jgi:hypothetical protein
MKHFKSQPETLPNHCINLPVGAASWPRIAPRTALLQYDLHTGPRSPSVHDRQAAGRHPQASELRSAQLSAGLFDLIYGGEIRLATPVVYRRRYHELTVLYLQLRNPVIRLDAIRIRYNPQIRLPVTGT